MPPEDKENKHLLAVDLKRAEGKGSGMVVSSVLAKAWCHVSL